jgi:hypothetical protein
VPSRYLEAFFNLRTHISYAMDRLHARRLELEQEMPLDAISRDHA